MDGLTGYQQQRLELADMIRAVLPIARAYGDDQREQQIRGLLTRLAAGRFQLAVIGQFSRGKTTLMNALLGEAYLPMGALPMTSVVTTVRYGTRARALVRSHAAALPVEVPVADVARFVARASAERTRMQVASVEVEIPAELLRLGFEFVDTPGVGSAIAANTAATLDYLPEADAVVFVSGFDSALTAAETDFLITAAGQAGKLFVVINKRDLVGDADAAEVTGYVQRWVRDSLPAEPPVFGISALQALDSAIARSPGPEPAGGIGPLRDALTRFLTAEQGRVALSNVAAAAAGLLARQQRDLRGGELTAGPAHDSMVAGFESRVGELQDRLAAVARRITVATEAAMTDVIAQRGHAWEAELAGLLGPAALVPDGAVSEPGSDPVPGALEALRLAGRQAAGDWLEHRAAEIGEALIAASASDISVLLDLARSAREMGAALAGLPVLDGVPAGWAAGEIPRLTVPVVDWTVPDPPARSRRRRGRGSAAEAAGGAISAAISGAVADFAGRAGTAFRVAAADWARRVGEHAGRLASAEAAQFRRYLSAPPRDGDLAVLTDLSARLASFRESLAARVPAAAGPEHEAGQPAGPLPAEPGAACVICAKLETAQSEYLIRRQFLLATSEADQARHAEAGGFCPLHTWQYAHLASPVGISAGYARLASQLASELREADAGSRNAGELTGRVAGLDRARACPACAVLARAEQDAAGELATRASGAGPPQRLCLSHLALVLEKHPPLAAGQAMTAALAATLARASENMRALGVSI
ncbi:MAG TPA: dynamin family protein [Streptosporangiaceae bacterium]|nr:dynamin family protein [Streptosporangiaceae bacterium]